MHCSCVDIRDAAERQFSHKRATKDLAQYRIKGPGSTTRLLLDGLATTGPVHGRLLDIGSGVGVLSFELLERGLTSAVGVDLSSAHVAIAAQEASRRGRSDATRFVHGDFLDVAGQLPSAEMVTLDRVVCCYPEYERFLKESLRHADRMFAFSYPLDVWYVRAWVALQNVGRQITRNAFRSFIHPVWAMDVPGVLPILRGRTAELAALLDADSALLHRRYPELDCGASGGRLLTLRGATLLHVAAEYGFFDATRLLLDRGADVNARADIDVSGVGGQTPIFHALTHFKGVNPEVAQLLIDRGADLTIRARVPGHYERSGEVLDVSGAEYGAIFPLR